MLPTPQLLNQVANFIQVKGKPAYYCLFLLGKEAGLRVSEAVNFNLSLKKKPNLYLIQGKKHKKRAVFIDPSIIAELKQNHWKPQQTNRFSFAHYLQRVKKELNISKEIELTPHTLRRCFATYQANSGMPLPVLQKVLGHSSIRTTALYWKSSQDPKEKAISDKWLTGKLPPEPSKPIKNKPPELPRLPVKEINWKIFFAHQRNFLEMRKIFLNIYWERNNLQLSSSQREINLFIENKTRNYQQKFLTVENQVLKEKVRQLGQEINQVNSLLEMSNNEKREQEQIIINLKNDKENLTKQLIQVQKDKETLLKLLSTDLKQQQTLNNKQENTPELHQQLIAQIQVITKN